MREEEEKRERNCKREEEKGGRKKREIGMVGGEMRRERSRRKEWGDRKR